MITLFSDSNVTFISKFNGSFTCFFYAKIDLKGRCKTMYPYQQFTQNYPLNYNKQEIVRVHGENGARAYQLSPNSSILLLDEISPIVWLKCTDGGGYPTLTPYTITPYEEKPQADISSLENRIIELEKKINESNNTKTKHNEQ